MNFLLVPIIFGALLLQLTYAEELIKQEEEENQEDFEIQNANLQQVRLIDEFGLNLEAVIEDIQNDLPQEFRRYSRQILELSQRLQDRIDKIHQRWSTAIENEENLVLRNLNRWVNRTSQDSNSYADDYERNRIKGYAQNVTEKVYACADLLNGDLQDYEGKYQDMNEIYRNVLSELRNQIEICYRKPSVECKRRITVEVRKLRNAPKDYSRLITEGSKLVTSDFEYRACIARVLEEFEEDQANFIRSGASAGRR